MTHLSTPELAKQGDQEAIASLMNHLLQDKGMSAKVSRKDNCLRVWLTSAQVPEQQSSVTFIRKVMISLRVESIQSVQVYGKQIGQDSPAWTESLDLTPPQVEEPKEQTTSLQQGYKDNLKAIAAENLNEKGFTRKQLTNGLLLLVLALGLMGVIYWVASNLRKTPEEPVPIASQAPSPQSPPSESFRVAVNNAMSAAKLTQWAKSQEDWNLVVNQWQQAIVLMKAVPASSPNYAVAQQKVVEYQKNLDFASSQVSRAK